MAFLHGYFDESGKFQDQPVVSFCGFVVADWEAFIHEWQYRLRKNHISHLHLSTESFRVPAKILEVYRPFIQTINKHVARGFGHVVDVKAFESLREPIRRALNDDPHYVAFSAMLIDLTTYARLLPDPTLSLVCDDDSVKACKCYELYNLARQHHPKYRSVLKSIAFADDKYYCQLQAADLFSWVMRAEAQYEFFGIHYNLRDLYKEFTLQHESFKMEFTTKFWHSADLQNIAKGNAL